MRKSYKSVEEFYKAVQDLISILRANGNETEASRLDSLMHCAWTSSSELIGELMLALAEMKGNYPKEIRLKIKNCHYFAKHHRRILRLK
jgi:hypothetical protein